uniref:Uncharacterized protein n=1 Tax=Eutreptiella gymnastica TaxID=73025 RepID=A0A7S1HV33_9EUGL
MESVWRSESMNEEHAVITAHFFCGRVSYPCYLLNGVPALGESHHITHACPEVHSEGSRRCGWLVPLLISCCYGRLCWLRMNAPTASAVVTPFRMCPPPPKWHFSILWPTLQVRRGGDGYASYQ